MSHEVNHEHITRTGLSSTPQLLSVFENGSEKRRLMSVFVVVFVCSFFRLIFLLFVWLFVCLFVCLFFGCFGIADIRCDRSHDRARQSRTQI